MSSNMLVCNSVNVHNIRDRSTMNCNTMNRNTRDHNTMGHIPRDHNRMYVNNASNGHQRNGPNILYPKGYHQPM